MMAAALIQLTLWFVASLIALTGRDRLARRHRQPFLRPPRVFGHRGGWFQCARPEGSRLTRRDKPSTLA